MSQPATEGGLLDELVGLSIPICQRAEAECPRHGPGCKPTIPEWVLAVMIMVAVMLKKKTKSAQYVWWREHRAAFEHWFPGQAFPGRSTFYDRYRRVHRLYQAAIAGQGRHAIAAGWADARCVAGDKSLIAGLGPRWNSAARSGDRPRSVDGETTWGYCSHDGWVQGYSFEVVVTAPADGPAWPLLASVDTASRSEQKTILDKIPRLPEQTKSVLLDAGYDSNAVGEAVEGTSGRPVRRCLCPPVPRPNTKRTRQPHNRETRERQRHRRLRDGRMRYFRSRRGRALYARRKTSVEPFHAQLKHLFELEHRVWHRGLANNRTMILAAIHGYQVLLTDNHRNQKPAAHLQQLLDAL
jgi:Transposase DDE domain